MRVMLLSVVASAALGAGAPEMVTFQGIENRVYDLVIDRPPAEAARRDALIVLLGGGLANDLDWTTPAEYSTTGEPLADAPRLSAMLTGVGFTVARYSTIHHGDPFKDQWPQRATTYTYPESLGLAAAAVRAAREAAGAAGDTVILLGHSLGARRAVQHASRASDIAGVVGLAPADLIELDHGRKALRAARGQVSRVMAEADSSRDDRIEPSEFQAWTAKAEQRACFLSDDATFGALDVDGSGDLVSWEITAHELRVGRRGESFAEEPRIDRHGLPAPEDVLARGRVPALLVFGGLDTWSFQAPLLQDRLDGGARDVVLVEVLPKLGHNLGEEREGRTGPIDERALEQVRVWLEARFPADAP